jgi:hypothetical protein
VSPVIADAPGIQAETLTAAICAAASAQYAKLSYSLRTPNTAVTTTRLAQRTTRLTRRSKRTPDALAPIPARAANTREMGMQIDSPPIELAFRCPHERPNAGALRYP